jgi:hypothetical protein
MMSKEQFEQLISKLDALIKITAANAFQGKPIAEVALLLSDFGFQNKEIASMLGTTPAYVGKVKYEASKERKKDKLSSKKKQAEKRQKQQAKGVEQKDEQGTV